ncbi:MAG: 2-oxo-3-hexenedioate decarboxylase [Gammaproteobacteria bacterium]
MALSNADIERLADVVEAAQQGAHTMAKLTTLEPALGLADGYAVQDTLRRRAATRGERVVGFKCGLTSRAKMVQMGVAEPGYGYLTSSMARADGGVIELAGLIHPRVEAEIALVLARDLRGPGVNVADVLAATAFAVPALEVIDSRFEAFKFDLPSVMADNASSARFVLGGRPVAIAGLDLATLGVVLEKNGEIVAAAAGAAVMGHPAAAACALVNHLGRRGETLPAGSIILTGGVTEAVAGGAGDHFRARVQTLGEVGLRFA